MLVGLENPKVAFPPPNTAAEGEPNTTGAAAVVVVVVVVVVEAGVPKTELDALALGDPNTDDDVEGATNDPNVETGVWPLGE